MKLNPDFILQEMGGEAVLVPTGEAGERFRGIVHLNETAAFIIERLKTETTQEKTVNALLSEYEVSREVAEKNVAAIIAQLREIGALSETS